jgi:hypothetical protein
MGHIAGLKIIPGDADIGRLLAKYGANATAAKGLQAAHPARKALAPLAPGIEPATESEANYRHIHPMLVPMPVVKAALEAARECAAERGIDHPVEISFFEEEDVFDEDERNRALLSGKAAPWSTFRQTRNLWGQFDFQDPKKAFTIYVNAGLSPDQVTEVAAHEVYHLDELSRGRWDLAPTLDGEKRATEYGQAYKAFVADRQPGQSWGRRR